MKNHKIKINKSKNFKKRFISIIILELSLFGFSVWGFIKIQEEIEIGVFNYLAEKNWPKLYLIGDPTIQKSYLKFKNPQIFSLDSKKNELFLKVKNFTLNIDYKLHIKNSFISKANLKYIAVYDSANYDFLSKKLLTENNLLAKVTDSIDMDLEKTFNLHIQVENLNEKENQSYTFCHIFFYENGYNIMYSTYYLIRLELSVPPQISFFPTRTLSKIDSIKYENPNMQISVYYNPIFNFFSTSEKENIIAFFKNNYSK